MHHAVRLDRHFRCHSSFSICNSRTSADFVKLSFEIIGVGFADVDLSLVLNDGLLRPARSHFQDKGSSGDGLTAFPSSGYLAQVRFYLGEEVYLGGVKLAPEVLV